MIDGWQEFFVAAAGAAAVLLGLAYIGVSDLRERPKPDDLRSLVENIALTLGYSVIVSLVMLVPEQHSRVTPWALGFVAILGILLALRPFGLWFGHRAPRWPKDWPRYAVALAGTLSLLLLAGALILGLIDPATAVFLVGAIVVGYLVIGIQDAWDVLVKDWLPES